MNVAEVNPRLQRVRIFGQSGHGGPGRNKRDVDGEDDWLEQLDDEFFDDELEVEFDDAEDRRRGMGRRRRQACGHGIAFDNNDILYLYDSQNNRLAGIDLETGESNLFPISNETRIRPDNGALAYDDNLDELFLTGQPDDDDWMPQNYELFSVDRTNGQLESVGEFAIRDFPVRRVPVLDFVQGGGCPQAPALRDCPGFSVALSTGTFCVTFNGRPVPPNVRRSCEHMDVEVRDEDGNLVLESSSGMSLTCQFATNRNGDLYFLQVEGDRETRKRDGYWPSNGGEFSFLACSGAVVDDGSRIERKRQPMGPLTALGTAGSNCNETCNFGETEVAGNCIPAAVCGTADDRCTTENGQCIGRDTCLCDTGYEGDGFVPIPGTLLDVTTTETLVGGVDGRIETMFVVGETPVRVTELGVFDDSQNGLRRALTATIETDNGTVLAQAEFSVLGGEELRGVFRFKDLDTPVELEAGFEGLIVVEGYGFELTKEEALDTTTVNETFTTFQTTHAFDAVVVVAGCRGDAPEVIGGTFVFETVPTGCVDIDECASNPCEEEQTCVNTDGGFECQCADGFARLPGKISCSDVNECEEDTHDCSDDSTCVNTLGSFECLCSRNVDENRVSELRSRDCPVPIPDTLDCGETDLAVVTDDDELICVQLSEEPKPAQGSCAAAQQTVVVQNLNNLFEEGTTLRVCSWDNTGVFGSVRYAHLSSEDGVALEIFDDGNCELDVNVCGPNGVATRNATFATFGGKPGRLQAKLILRQTSPMRKRAVASSSDSSDSSDTIRISVEEEEEEETTTSSSDEPSFTLELANTNEDAIEVRNAIVQLTPHSSKTQLSFTELPEGARIEERRGSVFWVTPVLPAGDSTSITFTRKGPAVEIRAELVVAHTCFAVDQTCPNLLDTRESITSIVLV